MEQKRELSLEEMGRVSGGVIGPYTNEQGFISECPTCGMPVSGVTTGFCRYCGDPLPEEEPYKNKPKTDTNTDIAQA